MTKFTALALRPIVYVLDIGVALTNPQTFKEARATSKSYLKIILSRYEDEHGHREGTGTVHGNMSGPTFNKYGF